MIQVNSKFIECVFQVLYFISLDSIVSHVNINKMSVLVMKTEIVKSFDTSFS